MWGEVRRDQRRGISARVVVYERLRRARIFGLVGRPSAPSQGPGLLDDLTTSAALADGA